MLEECTLTQHPNFLKRNVPAPPQTAKQRTTINTIIPAPKAAASAFSDFIYI